jgi:peptide/nickel transport system permease protein
VSRAARRRFAKRHLVRWDGIVGLLLLAAVVVAAVFADPLAPADPTAATLRHRFAPPGTAGFPLGADQLGRDVLSRVLFGARSSLVVGFAAVALAGVAGVALGLLAGFRGGLVDQVVTSLIEMQMAVPFLILAIAIAAVLPPSLPTVVAVLAISGWVVYARTVRAEVLTLRELDFVTAARATGASDLRIVVRHLLPSLVPTILVISTLQVPRMIIFEAALSYLGLGLPPPAPSWGAMVASAQPYLGTAWWASLVPGAAIFVTVFAINLFGDWLRDRTDPRR